MVEVFTLPGRASKEWSRKKNCLLIRELNHHPLTFVWFLLHIYFISNITFIWRERTETIHLIDGRAR